MTAPFGPVTLAGARNEVYVPLVARFETLRLGQYPGAVADLERYLKLAPLALDHAEIRGHLDHLRHWVAARN